mmetsp:Transcript_83920/g.271588  ORF Transcript_83920/g.271588 Transcript_83920/m.271588 type:complete len:486 (-) Transcript_83920:162-1619(-)
MATLGSVPAQAAVLALVSALLLCAGYVAGRHGALGRGESPHASFLAQAPSGLPTNSTATPDFNAAHLTDAVLERLRAAAAVESERPVSLLAASRGLEAHQLGAEELHGAVAAALAELASSFDPAQHQKLLRALDLIAVVDERVHAALQAVLPVAADRLSPGVKDSGEASADRTRPSKTWSLSVIVARKPFGMHIKRGTTHVEEVFPGFPAQKVGVRRGCELREVAGQPVSSGTWLEVFQRSVVPFAVKLQCGGAATDSMKAGQGHLGEDGHRYRVMVTRKPYGMNVQVNTVPRVVEVLPGFPAEAAGVRRGFVLIEVNDFPVTADDWFEQYQSAQLPFTLTFDTQVPLQPDNPYFKDTLGAEGAETHEASAESEPGEEEPYPGEGFQDFRCSVGGLPFGMHVSAPPGTRPQVVGVLADSLAARAGVRAGDVLVEVAGRPVTSANWFPAMQQAVTPYGLLFRRPNSTTTTSAAQAPAGVPAADPGA